LTWLGIGARLESVSSLRRFFVGTLPVLLGLLIGAAPLAECFAPPPGEEMPCCANMHHDESCGQAGSVAKCCEHSRVQESSGVMVAKPHHTPAVPALLSPIVVAPGLSQLPAYPEIAFDASPPPRSTRLHIVLSVFLI